MTTEIVWTALPRGRDAATLHLSVHVSPRLSSADAEPPLSDFPEMVTWPPPDLQLKVAFPGFAPYAGVLTSVPNPALWSKVFTPSSPVRSYVAPDLATQSVHTYPLAKVAAFLRDRYAAVALSSPEDLPATDELLAAGFADISFRGGPGSERWSVAAGQLDQALSGPGVVDTTAPSPTTFDFFQLRDFFAALDTSDPGILAALAEEVPLPRPEFHWVVQGLNQHPPLLRLLGLVFDVDVELGTGPAPSGSTTVEIVPQSEQLATAVHRIPRTRCVLGAATFAAEPGPGAAHLADGFLRFEDPSQFETVLVEADGGGIKAVDFAGNLEARVAMATAGDRTDAALPALRADGFSVARLGQAAKVKFKLGDQVLQQAALAAGALELHAEDLVRGQRIDVWDSRSGAWHSLMRRTGTYDLAGTLIPLDDEGVIGTSATRKPLQPDLYVTEEVFAWDGWSLIAPRPGRTLNTDPSPAAPMLDRPPNAPGPDYDVQIRVDVKPGTLPTLRYGVDYRFRARTVDLAGNSLPPDSPLDSHATPALAFGRFEPPQTPPVLLLAPRGPGESMETVVLRSTLFHQPAVPPTAQRHLVPPKVGEQTVERHGLLDVPDPAAPGQIVLDASVRDLLSERDAATLLNHAEATPDPEDPVNRRYYATTDLPVTWAPDPAARRFAFRLLDGQHAGYSQTFPFLAPDDDDVPDVWPFFESWRLVVVEGSGPPVFDETTRVLTVPLAKGDVVHARLSAAVDPADLDAFGLWHWISSKVPAGPVGEQLLADQRALVEAGQHWMFEPYRVLTLVHAVRQPLLRPELPDVPVPLQAAKELGDTWAEVSGQVRCHRLSTARIDVLASWADPVDGGAGKPVPDLPGAPGSRVVTDQSAFVLRIAADPAANPLLEDFIRMRHELGDTKHRVVTYRAVATTRFAEFFTSRATFPFAGPGSTETLPGAAQGLVPGSVKLSQVLGGATALLVEGDHHTVDTSTGQVTFSDGTQGTALPAGGDIRAAYLVPPIARETADPPTQPGELGPRHVVVESSARPTAPKVLYAVPTFGWESGTISQQGHAGVASTRHGNGVRIYLERPWWSSGAGELLGIVIWPPAELAVPPKLDDEDPLRPYVTQWGDDPIYAARATVAAYPRLASFTAATALGNNLTLAELGPEGPTVNVAGHDVAYDAARDLWYCDLTVDAGPSYQPFVRLALARYQPSSTTHAHLSPVVLADFVQLAPDRFATVVFDQANPKHATVTVTGPAHHGTEVVVDDPGPARVMVERRDEPANDPDLGWKQVGPVVDLVGQVDNGVATWLGTVSLAHEPGHGHNRLVIEQYEVLGYEQENQSANPFLPGSAERLVYSDLIVL